MAKSFQREIMNYKLNSKVFFKKVGPNEVNILSVDDDNFIYKIDKIAASAFLLVIEEKLSSENVKKHIVDTTGKNEADVKKFLESFYDKMVELNFFVKG